MLFNLFVVTPYSDFCAGGLDNGNVAK
jgi:hypothetical protein